ncbi:hypothetical protein [Zobellella sp. An-6]|uniref:hypothetical protein n=1 Tax=Zobellella sp. An-6 TaxID=3400218 RepID=UPI0040411334
MLKTVSLTKQQLKALADIANCSPGFKAQGVLGDFLDLWLVCEVLAKKLITYHKNLSDIPFRWSYTQLEASFKHLGISYCESKVKTMFHSDKKAKRGSKPARVLKNGYLHTLSDADREEIESRASELLEILNY